MTVALSKDFLLAFSNIQKSHQKKVREFCEKFQSRPDAPGLNYEPVKSARDKNFFSLRVDEAYRAIVARPRAGVYVLMWVDHHDEAYRWAERTRLQVNPETGALQVLAAEMAAPASATVVAGAAARAGELFAAVKDKHLLRLGVPAELLPRVRAMDNDGDLERAEEMFPQEAYEALFLLASGYDFDQAVRELEKTATPDAPADVTDFQQALANPDSLRRFYVVEGAQELAEILAAPLAQWRIFLHPSQRKLVGMHAGGPVRVLGGAGTGKTVTAMHRARYLAEQVFTAPGDRILFTTFTRNLATDISQNLRALCTPAAWARIEVRHLDGWVSALLAKQGVRPNVVYGENDECWRAALAEAPSEPALPDSFYRMEWENVIQAQNVTSLDAYLTVPRLGRGTRLPRSAKRAIWPVFAAYRAELRRAGKKEYVDLARDARELLENRKAELPYRAVVVDETQDLSPEALRLIRAIVPAADNDLFLVGDAHQRIYRHRASLGRCGIDIRGRGKKLRVNYRTTEEIGAFAVRLLDATQTTDDLDGGSDDLKGYLSLTHGERPLVCCFPSAAEEMRFLLGQVAGLAAGGAPPETICLVARTNQLLSIYANGLNAGGIETHEIKRDAAEQAHRPGLRLATMHRVKGLEFDHVFIAAVNDGIVPLAAALASGDDEVSTRNLESGERSLLYVALTRARKSAGISGYGTPSPYLAIRRKPALPSV